MAGRSASTEYGSTLMIRYKGHQMTSTEQQALNFREAEALEDIEYVV